MDSYGMNPQRAKHMGQKHTGEAPADDVKESSGQHHAPHIHIHSHEKGHTVHVMHHHGGHEKHEHAHGDAEGIASHIHKHIGGASGQDHGEGDGALGEELGAGV